MNTDSDYLYAEKVRRALVLRDGQVDFDDYVTALTDRYREHYGLPTQGRLQIHG